jgi:predicted ATPase
MIHSLRPINFKNFPDARLSLGKLTLLVGANASGKSNVQDALRFLHGVGRGYKLAEIIVEKWMEGGVLQWSGIRGGVREIAYCNARTFGLETELENGRGKCRLSIGRRTNGEEPCSPGCSGIAGSGRTPRL